MTECMSGYDRRAVIRVGDGRGFIVGAGDDRYVITAAHCLPPLDELPTPHLANDTANLTFRNIIGRVAAKRLTIWGELCVFSLCDDIAVFSAPDGQELYDEYERYKKFTRWHVRFASYRRNRRGHRPHFDRGRPRESYSDGLLATVVATQIGHRLIYAFAAPVASGLRRKIGTASPATRRMRRLS
jgi:hypothetical protein